MSQSKYIQDLQNEVQILINEVEHNFVPLSDANLLIKNAPQVWNVIENLNHLLLSNEYLMLHVIEKIASLKPEEEEFNPSWLGKFVVRIIGKNASGIYAPKFKTNHEFEPAKSPILNPRNVLEDYIQQLRIFTSVLEQLEGKSLSDSRIRLPFWSWLRLDLGSSLAFFIAHNQRHIRQAKFAAAN